MFSSVSTGLSRFEKGNHAISAFPGKSASAVEAERSQFVHFALQNEHPPALRVACLLEPCFVFLNSRKMLSHHPAFSTPQGRLSQLRRALTDRVCRSAASVAAARPARGDDGRTFR
jgi:hypothetical protein